MAMLGRDPERERRAAERSCGECSLCCTLLRVDELAKPAGQDCVHQRRTSPDIPDRTAGCGIYETRPPICRGYRCLWLQGGLEDDERPDRTGGIVDLESVGPGVRLAIRELRRGIFDESIALQAIAERYRAQMPVRVSDAEDVANPDRPFRVLLADDIEHRVLVEHVEIRRGGVVIENRRMPWAERWARRLLNRWRATGLARLRRS